MAKLALLNPNSFKVIETNSSNLVATFFLSKDCSFNNKFVSSQNKIDQIWDFAENAAIAANCDIIVTCDTSVAHLAGGMGLKVWLLLTDVPFWTWGLYGQSTFWYPSMRLFRQDKKNDWISLFETVGLELKKELTIKYD